MSSYNIKSVLLGVGVGMILTSVLNISFVNKDLSKQELENEAKKHNLILINANELIDKKNNSNSTANPSSEKENKDDGFVEVYIEKGSTSEEVANLLKNAGLISEEKAFISELAKQKKSYIIQYGKYKIKKGIETQELINIITTVNR